MNLFELLHDKYILPDKPKLFEAFAGIGCQRMGFERAGIECESVGISEIDKYAVQSYNAMHGEAKNYGDITKIQGSELPQIDVFTWSFPCTDLSKAGKQKGLTDTRSGLVYEVLRILHEMSDKPKVLIMENVVDLVQSKFIREFQEIQTEIERMGYSNYAETLNAKDYGVAQNRDRVFMVSILGDYYYEFPKPIPLQKRLKDYLESEVDEKYYLSDSTLNMFYHRNEINEERWNGFKFEPQSKESCGKAITTRAGSRADDNFIKEPSICDYRYDEGFRSREEDDISPTLPATHLGTTSMSGQPFVIEPTICASRGRENGQELELKFDGTSNALTTVQKDNMVVEPNVLTPKRTEHGKSVRKNYERGLHEESRHTMTELTPREDGISNTLTTIQKDNMLVVPPEGMFVRKTEDGFHLARNDAKQSSVQGTHVTYQEGNLHCMTTGHVPMTMKELRIRKLTPLECWRLMGIDDKYFHRASQVCSNSQLYKQAGNGIVVDVFAAIVAQMKKENT